MFHLSLNKLSFNIAVVVAQHSYIHSRFLNDYEYRVIGSSCNSEDVNINKHIVYRIVDTTKHGTTRVDRYYTTTYPQVERGYHISSCTTCPLEATANLQGPVRAVVFVGNTIRQLGRSGTSCHHAFVHLTKRNRSVFAVSSMHATPCRFCPTLLGTCRIVVRWVLSRRTMPNAKRENACFTKLPVTATAVCSEYAAQGPGLEARVFT